LHSAKSSNGAVVSQTERAYSLQTLGYARNHETTYSQKPSTATVCL